MRVDSSFCSPTSRSMLLGEGRCATYYDGFEAPGPPSRTDVYHAGRVDSSENRGQNISFSNQPLTCRHKHSRTKKFRSQQLPNGAGSMPNGMISRGSSWSRPALVMVLYLGLGAAALGWTTLRGQATLWQLPGRSDPWVLHRHRARAGVRAGDGVRVAAGLFPVRMGARAAPGLSRAAEPAGRARDRRAGGGLLHRRGDVLPRRADPGAGAGRLERGVRAAAHRAAGAAPALDDLARSSPGWCSARSTCGPAT